MTQVQRFWAEEATNIRCVREADYDAALAREAALRIELDQCGAMVDMLLDREWAEHVGTGEISGRLGQAITEIHNELSASQDREAALQQRLNEADQRIDELAALRKDAERYRFLRDGYRAGLDCWDDQIAVCDSEDTVFGEALDLMTDRSMEMMAERVSLQLTKDSPEVGS